MARAYIVLARQDMDGQLLQILDLKPNTSQAIPGYNLLPQTHYKTFLPQNDTVAVGGGNYSADYYGVAAYLLDHVDDGGGAMSATEANTAAAELLGNIIDNNEPMTSANVGAVLENAGCAAGTLLDGNGSNGTIEELLRILSGEVFKVDAGEAAGSNTGYFVERPTVRVTVPGGGGRRSDRRAPTTVTLGATEDTAFRDIRRIVDGGELRLSCLSGNLAALASDEFVFENPAFTYGAAGTALNVAGDNIPATGATRAVKVYDASGNIIV